MTVATGNPADLSWGILPVFVSRFPHRRSNPLPSFGSTSTGRLVTTHLSLQTWALAVVDEVDCAVVSGRRGRDEQNKLLELGLSRLAWPDSDHNVADDEGEEIDGFARAIDLLPYFADRPRELRIPWDTLEEIHHFAGYALRVAFELSIPLYWGGLWRSFPDPGHFGLPEGWEPLSEANVTGSSEAPSV